MLAHDPIILGVGNYKDLHLAYSLYVEIYSVFAVVVFWENSVWLATHLYEGYWNISVELLFSLLGELTLVNYLPSMFADNAGVIVNPKGEMKGNDPVICIA